MNGYDIFDEDDAYFNEVRCFWPKMHGLKMLGVQDQGNTGTCVAQALITLMYTHTGDSDIDMGFHVKCSVKQLYDVFSTRYRDWKCFGLSLKEATDYITYHGLFRDSVYPWKDSDEPDTFTMPALPVEIFRSDFDFISVDKFELKLHKSPLAAYIFVTDGYCSWVEEGSSGVFTYTRKEIEQIRSFIKDQITNRAAGLGGHVITIVGVGGPPNDTYFLCQDSYGSKAPNCGYKKIHSNVFKFAAGCYVRGTETGLLISEDDEFYENLASFEPLDDDEDAANLAADLGGFQPFDDEDD